MPVPFLQLSDEKLFDYFNMCLPAWIMISLFPRWKHTIKIARHIALGFALMYFLILADAMLIHPDVTMTPAKMFEMFSSLDGVHQLLSKRESILGAWCHYVVFDLWTGIWIAEDAMRRNISQWLVLPTLFFTMMLGPAGLLFYCVLVMLHSLIKPKSKEL